MSPAVPWPPLFDLPAFGREPSGGAAAPAQTPSVSASRPEPLCPNCLTECDEDAYCSGCGRVVR